MTKPREAAMFMLTGALIVSVIGVIVTSGQDHSGYLNSGVCVPG
jgi:hypothetical protein